MRINVAADLLDFDRAVAWFLARTYVDQAKRHEIEARARARSWWIAHVTQASVVQSVFDDIERALKNGQGFQLWRKEAKKKLDAAWSLKGDASAFRVETIWRNASQLAYSRGRYEQMSAPAVKKMRPFWMYDAVMDSRTSPICSALNGTILPADDPWWDTRIPPAHHRCRSGIRTLRRSVAERKGITATAPDTQAQEGFGYAPDKRPDPGRGPEALSLDPDLAGEMNWRAKHLPPKLVEPKEKKPDPRYLPETYEHEFADYNGAPETRRALASARALQERGLDLPSEQLNPILEKLHEATGFAAFSMSRVPDGSTLRDMIKGESPDQRDRQRCEMAASIAGMLAENPAGSTPELSVFGSRQSKAKFGKALEDAKKRLTALVPQKSAMAADLCNLHIDGTKRAYYSNAAIHVKAGETGSTVVHEFGHHLENKLNKASQIAGEYLKARGAKHGNVVRKLRDLIKGARYKHDERAYVAGFPHAYMGKIYGFGDTELVSMGLEWLATRPGSFYSQDRELFLLTIGILSGG